MIGKYEPRLGIWQSPASNFNTPGTYSALLGFSIDFLIGSPIIDNDKIIVYPDYNYGNFGFL